MKFLLFASLLFAAPPPAPVPDPEPDQIKEFETDVRCLLDGNVQACLTKVKNEGERDGDRSYLEVACEVKSHPDSCAELGKWYATREQHDKASVLFEKSCELKSTIGCWQVLQRQIEKLSARGASETMSAAIVEGRALHQKLCTDDPKLAGQCRMLASRLEDANRSLEFKACELSYAILQSENRPPHRGVEKQGFPSSAADCRQFCNRSLGQLKLESDDLQVHAQCLYDTKPIGSSLFRSGRANEKCRSLDALPMGEVTYYPLCHCERQSFDSLNALGAPFGVFAGPETSQVKNLGKNKWYRCAVGFHYWDSSAARKDASHCQSGLRALKSKLLAALPKSEFEPNFTNLNCASSTAEQGAQK